MNAVSFFKPEFFWALFFILVIILLHFFKRPRLTLLDFSTLRFFQADAVSSSRNRKLYKILQFITRVLAVITLIILFARPHDPRTAYSIFGNPQASVYVWIDNTFSMEYTKDSLSCKYNAETIVDSMHAILPSTIKLWCFDHQSKEFYLYGSQQELHSRFSGPCDIREAVDRFVKEAQAHPDAVFTVFSDFQKSTLPAIDSAFENWSTVKKPLILVSCTPELPWNYALQNAAVLENRVTAQIRTFNHTADAVRAVVTMNGINRGETAVNGVKRDSIATVSIETMKGMETDGLVSLDVNDPMSFDNKDCFSADHRSTLRIDIVGDRTRNYVISAALNAVSERDRYVISLHNESDVTYEMLDSSDIVIVNALRSPSRALDAFVTSKGTSCKSVVFCISASDSSLVWSRELLARAFTDNVRSMSIVHDTVYPVLPDTVSELWKQFPSRVINDLSITRYVRGFSGRPLVTFKNNDPFVLFTEDTKGKNWVVLTTSAGITDENTLFQNAFYVPLLDRCISFLNQKSRVSRTVWNAGEKYRNPFFRNDKRVSVYFEQTLISDNIAAQQLISFNETGIYRIVPDGEFPVFVKVQPDPAESVTLYGVPHIYSSVSSPVAHIENTEFIDTVHGKAASVRHIALWIVLVLLLLSEFFLVRSTEHVEHSGK